MQPSGYPTNFFSNIRTPAGIEVPSLWRVGHIPGAMVTSLTSTFEGKDAPNPHDAEAIVSSPVKPRATALSAPSLARRSAPTRPTKTSRPCNPGGQASASATSKSRLMNPATGIPIAHETKELVMPSPPLFSFTARSETRPAGGRCMTSSRGDNHRSRSADRFAESPTTLPSRRRSSTNRRSRGARRPLVWQRGDHGHASSSDKVAGLVYVSRRRARRAVGQRPAGTLPVARDGPLVRPAQLADGGVEVSIDPARFHDVFCADVPAPTLRSWRSRSARSRPRRSTIATRCTADEAVLGGVRYGGYPVTQLHRFSYDRQAPRSPRSKAPPTS